MKLFKPSPEIPPEVWDYVMDRDGWMCQNERCINKFGRYSNLTVHHIIPKGRGGLGTDPCNLIVLCWPCHEKISIIKHWLGMEMCDVDDPMKLMHIEPIPFYDHEFSPKDIICSHEEIKIKEKLDATITRQS